MSVEKNSFKRANSIMSALHESRGDVAGWVRNTSAMRDIDSIWDNGGETEDRYTIVFKDRTALGLSSNPDHPQGFSQWDHGVKPGSHLGKRIGIKDLPFDVQKHLKMRMEEGISLKEAKKGSVHKITDPKLKKAIDEMAELNAKVEEYKAEIKKLDKKQDELAKEVIPELEKICKETEDRIFRTEKALISLGALAHTRTTTQWKKLYDVLYNKVNTPIKNMMDDLKETVVNTREYTTQYKVKVDEDLNENILNKIKAFVRNVKKQVMGWMRSLKSIDKGIEELEKLSAEMTEAYQQGRKNNLTDIVGKTVTSVKDEGKTSINITFNDGSKLEVAGTDAENDAIYYKLHRRK